MQGSNKGNREITSELFDQKQGSKAIYLRVVQNGLAQENKPNA